MWVLSRGHSQPTAHSTQQRGSEAGSPHHGEVRVGALGSELTAPRPLIPRPSWCSPAWGQASQAAAPDPSVGPSQLGAPHRFCTMFITIQSGGYTVLPMRSLKRMKVSMRKSCEEETSGAGAQPQSRPDAVLC